MMRIYVVGGDRRMDFAAKYLQDAGYEVIRDADAPECDALVLPVNAGKMHGDLIKKASRRGLAVIGGMLPEGGACTYDYMKDEAFLFDNARITAEGALMLLGAGMEGTLYDADVAILGMGRIAECLCRMLCALGVRTTVYARRPEALARARALGAKTVCFSGTLPPGITSHDALCNTVPHMLLDEALLAQMKKSTLLLELASTPGGFDMESVGRHGLHVVNGQGIPGKYAPRAAGRLIADYTVKALKGEREYE